MSEEADELLMAYADGELSPGDRSAFERKLAGDRRLQSALAQERLLRSRIADTYDPALAEEVPERLVRLIDKPRPRILALPRPNLASAGWRWQHLAAMAASLALALFLAYDLTTADDAPEDASYRIAGATAEALDVQLASAQSPAAPVQIGVSFIGPGGEPCRTFEVSQGAGLACRSGGEWKLRLFTPGTASSGAEYQRAGSASAKVMSRVQELIAGEPMDAEQERRARDAGWPAAGD